MATSWLLDEFAYVGSEHLDPDAVAGYDRKQGSVPDEAAAADIALLRSRGLGERSTVVDLNAGTSRTRARRCWRRGWLEPMLDAAGFDIVEVDYRDAVYAAYTCIKR